MVYWIRVLVVPLLLALGVNIGHVRRRLSILAGLLAVAQEVLEVLYRRHCAQCVSRCGGEVGAGQEEDEDRMEV